VSIRADSINEKKGEFVSFTAPRLEFFSDFKLKIILTNVNAEKLNRFVNIACRKKGKAKTHVSEKLNQSSSSIKKDIR